MSKKSPKLILLVIGVLLISAWLFVGTLPISEADNEQNSENDMVMAPLQTEEPSDNPNPDGGDGGDAFDTENMPETLAITGTIINGTPDGLVPDGLTVNLISIEFDQAGQPIAEIASEEITAEGTSFSFDALPVTVNAGVVAQVIYNDVPFVSQIVPAHQETDGLVEFEVTIYDITADTSTTYFSEIWYIVGASPEEDLTEVYNWYFVRNETDKVIYDAENGAVRIPLPPGAFAIQVDDTSGRFQIQETESGSVLVDFNPLRPGEEDQIIVNYLLPYNEGAMTFTQTLDYPAERLNVYVARVFDLKFEADGFSGGDVTELRGLGDYARYSNAETLPAGELLTFDISGTERLAPVEEDTASSEEGGGLFGNSDSLNANVLLVIGALMVALGFAYLFVDLQRQRAKVTVALHNVQSGGTSGVDSQSKDRLLDEIAQLDEAFENGEIEEAYYNRKREELKDRLREIMG